MTDHLRGFALTQLRIAQRGRCYLCGHEFHAFVPRGVPFRRAINRTGGPPSKDHVVPRARGGRGPRNKLLAHVVCNSIKSDRAPYPCELLFLEITNIIAEGIAE